MLRQPRIVEVVEIAPGVMEFWLQLRKWKIANWMCPHICGAMTCTDGNLDVIKGITATQNSNFFSAAGCFRSIFFAYPYFRCNFMKFPLRLLLLLAFALSSVMWARAMGADTAGS